jgi:hypothetical protein
MTKIERHDPEELAKKCGSTFTTRVALVTMIFAMLLAITSLGENNATKEMLLTQQLAADQRASYQSQVIGENLYKTNGLRMEADLLERGPAMRPNIRILYGAMLKDLKAEEMRYREGKKKSEAEAISLEAKRDRNRAKDPYFDYAEFLLQLSIVTASVSILSVSLRLFTFSIGSAALGTLFMLNGYFLIFRLPFFH